MDKIGIRVFFFFFFELRKTQEIRWNEWKYFSYRDNLISNFSRAYLIGFKRSISQIDNPTTLCSNDIIHVYSKYYHERRSNHVTRNSVSIKTYEKSMKINER